jgi:hypothetical protein
MRRTIRNFGSVEDYILAQAELYGDEGSSLLEAQLVCRLNGSQPVQIAVHGDKGFGLLVL